MINFDVEELFKSKRVARNKALTDALLRNQAILNHEKATDLDKKIANANIARIAAYSSKDPKMKPIDPKTVMAPVIGAKPSAAPAVVQEAPVVQEPKAKVKRPKLDFHPDFVHFNVTPEEYKNLPSAHKQVFHDFHKEVLSGQHPELHAKIKSTSAPAPAAPAIPDIKKSVERLNSLIKTIKERLNNSV